MSMLTQGRGKGLRAAVAGMSLLLAATPAVAQQKFTDWGWPLPYEQVSAKSVEWLKAKGWGPVQVAFQAPWSGQNTINIVMDREGLKRWPRLLGQDSRFVK
ncbi:MAG: hypothetical protein ACYC9Z_14495 [Casimicrobiaceae bacterium]